MPKLCRCGAIVDKRCDNCYRPPKRGTTAERGYGNDWRKLSERFRANNPLCQRCEEMGLVTPSEHVHHIVPIREATELRLEPKNLRALCMECHEIEERANHGRH